MDNQSPRQIAILATDGVDENRLFSMKDALRKKGISSTVISPKSNTITGLNGAIINVDEHFSSTTSDSFDAVYIPSGEESIFSLQMEQEAIIFINDAFRNQKVIAADAEGEELLYVTHAGATLNDFSNQRILLNPMHQHFAKAINSNIMWISEERKSA